MWIYRIKYTKTGRIRFISHLDVMRALTRALNRADIPVAYSKGFNPRPKISMGPPLPLGYESRCEMADLVLARMLPPVTLHQQLGAALPEGLNLMETDWASGSLQSLSGASSVCYMIELKGNRAFDDAGALIRDFLEKDSVSVERIRKDAHKVIDVRPLVVDARLVPEPDSTWMHVEISLGDKGSCSASEVAQAIFNLSPENVKCLRIIRTEIKYAQSSPKVRTHEERKEKEE